MAMTKETKNNKCLIEDVGKKENTYNVIGHVNKWIQLWRFIKD
jgi:hypothetical protein